MKKVLANFGHPALSKGEMKSIKGGLEYVGDTTCTLTCKDNNGPLGDLDVDSCNGGGLLATCKKTYETTTQAACSCVDS